MIKFNCKTCGKRISTPDGAAGKKGRCPSCQTILRVPEPKPALAEMSFVPEFESEPVPDLNSVIDLPFVEPSNAEKDQGIDEESQAEIDDYVNSVFGTKQEPPKRKLPAFIDVFLYPISKSGLLNLFMFWILAPMSLIVPIFGGLIYLCLWGALFFYYFGCINDSAEGSIRAQDNLYNTPSFQDLLVTFFRLVAVLVVFWSPVSFYSIYKLTNEEPISGPAWWVLMALGWFTFPMGIIQLAVQDDISALNPVMLLVYIVRTFFCYIGLVILFAILTTFGIFARGFVESTTTAFWGRGVGIYMTMVICHLMGRFYYKHSDQLC